MPPKKKVSFFRLPPFFYVSLIIGGMSLLAVVAFAPHVLPYDSLWYLGTFLHYMAYDLSTLSIAICCVTLVIHVLEAAYAYHLSRKLNLTNEDTFKWTVQTFVIGFPSLGLLRARANKSQKQSS